MKKDSKQRLLEVMQRVDPSFKQKLNEGEGWHIDVKLDFPKNTSSINAEGRDMANNFPLTEEGLFEPLYKIYADSGKRYYNLINVAYVNPRGRSGQYEMEIMTPAFQKEKWVARDLKDNIEELFIEINKDDGTGGGGGVPAPGAEKQGVSEKYNRWSQAQDAWAEIEGTNTQTGKNLQKKVNLDKKGELGGEVGSGNGDSHVPEYYFSYDSEDAIPNTKGLTQGQIDAMNDKSRENMEMDVRRSFASGSEDMYESKEKFKFGKSSKKRLFEVMQRVAPNFEGKALNEGGWNLPDNVRSDDPHFNPDPEDNYSHWELEKAPMGGYNVSLKSEHSGSHEIDWEYLIPDEEEFAPFLNQLKANPKDPELHKRIDVLVDEYLQNPNLNNFEWTYQDPY